jgi:hypothetical protein
MSSYWITVYVTTGVQSDIGLNVLGLSLAPVLGL